jgi:hypothetical protein
VNPADTGAIAAAASSCLIFPVFSDPMQTADVGRHGPCAHSRRVWMCSRKPLDQIVCPDFHDVRDAARRAAKTASGLGKNQLFRCRCGSSARSSHGRHLVRPPVVLPPYSIGRPAFSGGVSGTRFVFETQWSAPDWTGRGPYPPGPLLRQHVSHRGGGRRPAAAPQTLTQDDPRTYAALRRRP